MMKLERLSIYLHLSNTYVLISKVVVVTGMNCRIRVGVDSIVFARIIARSLILFP